MKIADANKEYSYTPTLVYSCQYHVIWATKYRRNVLTPEVQVRLKEIIKQVSEEMKFFVLEMEMMEDHVHLLLDVNPHIGIYKIVSQIKGMSSKLLREEFNFLKTRLPTLWTRGKFISTVGSVSLEVVKKYIEGQKNK
jgi:putative transposase